METPTNNDFDHSVRQAKASLSRILSGETLGTDFTDTKHRNFIFNPDLDGILSAAYIVQHLGWTPIGVAACNGCPNDTLLAPEGWNHNDNESPPVFVDVWIEDSGLCVLDQHITAYDDEQWSTQQQNPKKVNPNLLWKRTFVGNRDRGFTKKYPFGVVHFIIAGLEHMGKNIYKPPQQINRSITSFDVLLRADDAANSTAGRFPDNAKDWWSFLTKVSQPAIYQNQKSLTLSLSCYAQHEDQKKRAQATKSDVEYWLKDLAKKCNLEVKKDGGFADEVRCRQEWTAEMQEFTDRLVDACGLKQFSLKARSLVSTQFKSSGRIPPAQCRNVLDGSTPFSYAFTSTKDNGFSYTA